MARTIMQKIRSVSAIKPHAGVVGINPSIAEQRRKARWPKQKIPEPSR
jgi:hypothetical protein